MSKEKEIRSVWKLIILHLFPGIVFSIIYVFLLKVGVFENYPKLFIFSLAGIFSIIPLELGYLFYVAKKEVGSFNIFKILGLESKLKVKEYIFYTLLLFIVTGILMTALKPLSNNLLNTVFGWIPSSYNYVQDMSQFDRNIIIISILVRFFVFTLILPIIEELYFRGYLLARMKWMGKYSVFLNVILFSVYHFWSPWLIITRILSHCIILYIKRIH
ncbi:CPBP family glutamic-type intramembrane protease [Bacillus sp. JJ1764]|uniref:CPBP family glutamic-type intramembrane protease n=1 Tax=Bacillus sp. JJ1764 TaxID=3122964 RepID=UPI002FFEA6A9